MAMRPRSLASKRIHARTRGPGRQPAYRSATPVDDDDDDDVEVGVKSQSEISVRRTCPPGRAPDPEAAAARGTNDP
ncbi:hypothetical protein PG993_006246 [Apiospora rasikravindrae]|uniref:Uncharacterized protein n=1 Tax=Apiospora rasikravindrae TaxID=990691 RepID=A0ABR1T559_9PEZI